MTDASYCPDTGAAGYGYWIACKRGKRGGGGSMGGAIANSTTAELIAICNAINIGYFRELIREGDHVLVQTDCVAAILALENRRVLTVEGEKAAAKRFHGFRNVSKITVSFRHVKGHSKKKDARYVANHMCDKHAKDGMYRARARLQEIQNETNAS